MGVTCRSSIISLLVAVGLHASLSKLNESPIKQETHLREILDRVRIGVRDVLSQRVERMADAGLANQLEGSAGHPLQHVDVLSGAERNGSH